MSYKNLQVNSDDFLVPKEILEIFYLHESTYRHHQDRDNAENQDS